MNFGLIEQLTHSTVRIETILQNGSISTGTGFYMNLLQENNSVVPVIVTNKHVVSGAQVGKFHVTLANEKGLPNLGNYQLFEIPHFEQKCIKHPFQDVDLAVFPIAPLLHQVKNSGGNLFYTPLDISLIPKDEF